MVSGCAPPVYPWAGPTLMQIPLKKLASLLEAEQRPEVRHAAARVLGELGVKDADLGKTLLACLADPDPTVRLEVIRAIGKLHIEQALPLLVARIKEGGEEAAQAAQAAARLGARGTRTLQDLMPQVAPGLRRYIAAALAGRDRAGAAATLAVLLDRDAGVVEAAVRALIGQVPTLTSSQRRGLVAHLRETLADKKTTLAPASETAFVRLLAALNDPEAQAVLWDRLLPPHPPQTRAAALQAVGRWVASPGKEQLRRLFLCAADEDFRVAAPALVILKGLPISDRAVPEWLTLLRAADVAVRRLALEKIGSRDKADVAAALCEQLSHPDAGLRQLALTCLNRLEHGRKALARSLLEADSAERAWALARPQAPFVKDYPPGLRAELFAQAARYVEAGDRRAEPLLFLLREADGADLRDRLEERALARRKKKDYATALPYLRTLARDPGVGFAVRWQLAACGLKLSPRDLSAEARASDPCLQQFASLCHGFEAELVKELEKAKWLEPEDLYYLGFHLAEKEGAQRRVGGRVLHLLLKRSGRSKLAQAAKAKLRSGGLE
jgi:HEAT repeat protein